jgi:energy-coupling factor transporter ATP-binding protein EcfA2
VAAFELTQLRFHAGPTPGGGPLDVTPGVVTLLVGPNNSGKSRALSELSQWASGGQLPAVVLANAEVQWPTFDEARVLLGSYVQSDPRPSVFRVAAPAVTGGSGGQDETDLGLIQSTFDPALVGDPERQSLRRRFTLRYFTALWTGRERFALASDQQLTDLLQPPQNHLQVLFRDDVLRARLSTLIHDAFGLYFVLDPTQPGQVRMRLSATPPPSPAVERGLDDRALGYHATTIPLSELSDGVQCYVGMVAALMSLPLKLVLLDEPEAFLHPPLARRLGSAIADTARARGARVVAATHSAEFLRGCVESAASTSIVRVTYDRVSDEATARSLTTSELRPLMTEPLLRSTRALEGLFHRAVIVGESDADRAFYDEINRRLVGMGKGVMDAQFVNAQNWSTEARVIAPLRRLGVPAAGVVDFDTLWNSMNEWRPLYRAIGLADGSAERIEFEREQAALARDPDERSRCKARGIAGLPAAKRPRMRQHVEALAQYGLFVVPIGELEGWLPELRIPTNAKHRWIVDVLTRMGTDPSTASYVHPGRGGVWRFINQIEAWAADPRRSGML